MLRATTLRRMSRGGLCSPIPSLPRCQEPRLLLPSPAPEGDEFWICLYAARPRSAAENKLRDLLCLRPFSGFSSPAALNPSKSLPSAGSSRRKAGEFSERGAVRCAPCGSPCSELLHAISPQPSPPRAAALRVKAAFNPPFPRGQDRLHGAVRRGQTGG